MVVVQVSVRARPPLPLPRATSTALRKRSSTLELFTAARRYRPATAGRSRFGRRRWRRCCVSSRRRQAHAPTCPVLCAARPRSRSAPCSDGSETSAAADLAAPARRRRHRRSPTGLTPRRRAQRGLQASPQRTQGCRRTGRWSDRSLRTPRSSRGLIPWQVARSRPACSCAVATSCGPAAHCGVRAGRLLRSRLHTRETSPNNPLRPRPDLPMSCTRP